MTRYKQYALGILSIAFLVMIVPACKKKNVPGVPDDPKPVTPVKSDVELWLTNADQSAVFSKQNQSLVFSALSNNDATIEVDTAQSFQTMDGFGYTLTGGSATLINSLKTADKAALLQDLFLTDGTHIGVSYLRISIGASDLSSSTFTYNDLPNGQQDLNLNQFSIDKERTDLLPILKQIVALNPAIKIMGSPWTAPTWMKTNNAFKGGKLKPEYYAVYARYLVKYIQVMKAEGITIDAITPQNEPLHEGNNPSMGMSASEQADFIKNHLGPAFRTANINTKIIIYDHNASRPDYPIAVLNDPDAKQYIDGSAFHLYEGSINNLMQVRDAHPDKGIYFTEQWVGGPGNFRGDLGWHIENLIVGATRNWSRNVLEWNLAADPAYRPYTDGGCSTCLGALTIGTGVTRNVAYYIIAHASKFVSQGSVRIASNMTADLPNVAFKNPAGKKVLIVINKSAAVKNFNIKFNGKLVAAVLNAGSVGTYVW